MAYDITYDQGVQWEVVQTGPDLERVTRELADVQTYAWDVETTGLNVWAGARIIGHAFAWRSGPKIRSCYIPMRHEELSALFAPSALRQLPPDVVTAALKPILENPQTNKIAHNAQFDTLMAYADGIVVDGKLSDTITACKLINENEFTYKLEACLKRAKIPHDDTWKKRLAEALRSQARERGMTPTDFTAAHGYKFVPIDACGRYACQDAVYELRLAEWAFPQQAPWAHIWEMEQALIWACIDIQRVGVPIDMQVLGDLAREQQAEMSDLEPKIYALAGTEFDAGNQNTVRKVLYDRLGLPVVGYTEKDQPSVDDDALWQLGQQGYQIANLLRQYSAHSKVLTTYTESISKRVDSAGLLHGELDPGGAKTGRMSAREPNLQNIPVRTELGRRVRSAFKAREGFVRYCLDYSQIELRVLAHLSQDPVLQKIYHQGLDAHQTTAIEVFGTAGTVDGIDMRRIAKILNFGTSFGMTEHGLMRNVNKDLPAGQTPIDEQRAKEFRDRFYQKYAGVESYQRWLIRYARQNRCEVANLFGRPRRLPNLVASEKWKRGAAERQLVSTMVQGTAADIVKHSMIAVRNYLRSQTDCEAYLVLMVHDDLQFDMVPEGSAKVIREVRRLMEQTVQDRLSVPIKVDAEYFTTHWAAKKKLKEWRS